MGTSKFFIQVSQYKFIVLKILSRKIFGEFRGFFPKGLIFLKFEPNSMCLTSKNFNSKSVGISSPLQKESCSILIDLHPSKVWIFLEKRKCSFCILKLELVEILEKE
jgi:hypothetical protein